MLRVSSLITVVCVPSLFGPTRTSKTDRTRQKFRSTHIINISLHGQDVCKDLLRDRHSLVFLDVWKDSDSHMDTHLFWYTCRTIWSYTLGYPPESFKDNKIKNKIWKKKLWLLTWLVVILPHHARNGSYLQTCTLPFPTIPYT